MTHPALAAFLSSLTPAERKEWEARDLYAECKKAPQLSAGLFGKFERCCTEILGYTPKQVAA